LEWSAVESALVALERAAATHEPGRPAEAGLAQAAREYGVRDNRLDRRSDRTGVFLVEEQRFVTATSGRELRSEQATGVPRRIALSTGSPKPS
jgi:hypothetical protein